MLTTTLIALVLAIPLSSAKISATLYTRIVTIALVFAATLSYHCYNGAISPDIFVTSPIGLDGGLGLYSGLIQATTLTQIMAAFMQLSGAVILLC
jgi:hypothetical protein